MQSELEVSGEEQSEVKIVSGEVRASFLRRTDLDGSCFSRST